MKTKEMRTHKEEKKTKGKEDKEGEQEDKGDDGEEEQDREEECMSVPLINDNKQQTALSCAIGARSQTDFLLVFCF